jgi:type I restriction enzyme R subunit
MGPLLRALTGLERAAAAAAFDDFLAERNLTANQLHFVDLVVDYLARNGTVEVEALYEHPFTSHAPRGPEDVFPEPDVDAMVAVLNRVRANAIAIDHVA